MSLSLSLTLTLTLTLNPHPHPHPHPNPHPYPHPHPHPHPDLSPNPIPNQVSHELKVLAEMASLPTQAERRTLSRGRGPGTRRGTRRSKKAR